MAVECEVSSLYVRGYPLPALAPAPAPAPAPSPTSPNRHPILQGKGLLAEHLAVEYGEQVSVSLVELQSELVERATARTARSERALPNLSFYAGDAVCAVLSQDAC